MNKKWLATALSLVVVGGIGAVSYNSVFAASPKNSPAAVHTVQDVQHGQLQNGNVKNAVSDQNQQDNDKEVADDQNQQDNDKEVADDKK
ncbi:hypothetical protein ACI7RC_12135 [Brevibacillus sp. B_LB10_24]|uniref:hypothetical protein n=1 Tax=Brevibacillus sp. B_LB10_24 TaxID=3380645 RepID=UPI0038BD19FA